MIELIGTPPGDQRTWLVFLRPTRPGWPTEMTEAERHALSAHFQQLQELTAAGVCVVAGPTLDADYGICIMDGLDQVEVLARLEHDAMVSAGFFRAELRAYKLSLERSH